MVDRDDEECLLSPLLDLSSLPSLSFELSLSFLLDDSLLDESLLPEDEDLDLEETGPLSSLHKKLPPSLESVLEADEDFFSEVGEDFLSDEGFFSDEDFLSEEDEDFLSGERCFSDELLLGLSLDERSPEVLRWL